MQLPVDVDASENQRYIIFWYFLAHSIGLVRPGDPLEISDDAFRDGLMRFNNFSDAYYTRDMPGVRLSDFPQALVHRLPSVSQLSSAQQSHCLPASVIANRRSPNVKKKGRCKPIFYRSGYQISSNGGVISLRWTLKSLLDIQIRVPSKFLETPSCGPSLENESARFTCCGLKRHSAE